MKASHGFRGKVNKNCKKGLKYLLAVVMLVLACQGCGAEKDEGVKYVVGVSQPNLSESWRIEMNDEIRREAAENENVKVVFYDAGQDTAKQKRDIQSLLSQRIDALIISVNETKSLSEDIAVVIKKGIPVIAVGYPPEGVKCSMLVYCDNFKLGRLAGEYAAEVLGADGGIILEVQGDSDSVITKERKDGFRAGIGSNPKIRIEYVVVGYWLRDKTEERVSEIFDKKPRANFIFAHNDAMAIGAKKVALQKELDVKCVGIGGVMPDADGLSAVKKGTLEATFLFPTGGKEALRYAVKILQGETVPDKFELQPEKVTRENVDSFLQDKYVEKDRG